MKTNKLDGACVEEIGSNFVEERVVEPETGPAGIVAAVLEDGASLAAVYIRAAVGSSVATHKAASNGMLSQQVGRGGFGCRIEVSREAIVVDVRRTVDQYHKCVKRPRTFILNSSGDTKSL